jgi:hypothetical protein
MELSDAMADAWAAARMTGGSFRQLAPIYGERMGLAYKVMRGQQIRRMGRTLALTAAIAAVGGAAVAMLSERAIAHRTATTEPADAETAHDAPTATVTT